jgi:hypothetical protein
MSNCQTFGLANSMNLLMRDAEISAVDIHTYYQNIPHYTSILPDYERVIIHQEFASIAEADFSGARTLDIMPSILFSGFHPDLCGAYQGDALVNGPLGAYHSIIALAAYNAGLSVADTLARFTPKLFESAGYFDVWAAQRQQLLASFAEHGLEIGDLFRRWGRSESFMYSTNHPRIRCLFDIALRFLEVRSLPATEERLMPMDNLVQGACFPVYPVIGEALGIAGSYLFKVAGGYRYLTLEEFVHGSFAAYDAAGGAITPDSSVVDRYAAVQQLLR